MFEQKTTFRLLLATLMLPGLGLLLAGCDKEEEAPPQQQEVILNVKTVDLAGRPVEEVRFYINGKKFGITDQDGTFRGRHPAKNGDTLSFNVEAPPGYSVPPNVDQSRWRLEVNYPPDGRLVVDFTATLQRPERDYLFMVRTKTPATPVKVNDKPVGKTGANGEVLLRVGGVPGTAFIAKAGEVSFQGKFAEDDEVYLLTPERQGPVSAGPSGSPVAAAPEPEPEPEPERPAPPVEVARVEPAPVEAAARPARPAEDPFAVMAASPRAEAPPRVAAPARTPSRAPPEPAGWDDTPIVAAPPPPPPPPPPPREPEPAPFADIIDDDPAPFVAAAPPPIEPELIPVDAPPPPPRPSKAAPVGDGLIDDEGGETVDRKVMAKKPALAAGSSPQVQSMSRQEVDTRLEDVKSNFERTRVLQRADVEFLSQVDRTHPGYFEANRLLADYYYQSKDYNRQTKALEVATSKGKYKHDPQILLSLAKAYARQKNFRKALSTMRDVEAKMRNLPPANKADAYRFHAEILEHEFLRQFNDDPKAANVTLVDKAVDKWERYKTYSQGADANAVSNAAKKIKELNDLKARVEL